MESGGLCLTFPPASVTVVIVAVPLSTVILGLILCLGPSDGEGGLLSHREPENQAGNLGFRLLVLLIRPWGTWQGFCWTQLT